MAFIITPLTIEGNKYCFPCQAGLVTKGIATDIFARGFPNGASHNPDGTPIAGFADCGSWVLAAVFAGVGLCGEISFGSSCLNSITIELVSYGEPGGYDDYTVYLDGVLYVAGSIDPNTTETELINLTPGPCGSVITVIVEGQSAADTIELAIIATT